VCGGWCPVALGAGCRVRTEAAAALWAERPADGLVAPLEALRTESPCAGTGRAGRGCPREVGTQHGRARVRRGAHGCGAQGGRPRHPALAARMRVANPCLACVANPSPACVPCSVSHPSLAPAMRVNPTEA